MEAIPESASNPTSSSRLRSQLRVSTLACAVLVLSILAPLPAEAQTGPQAEAICPNGSTCLWRDANWETLGYPGRYRNYFYYIPDFSSYTYPSTVTTLANTVSSAYNDGNSEWTYFFTGTYRTGDWARANIDVGVNFGWPYNDNLESGYYESCLDGVC